MKRLKGILLGVMLFLVAVVYTLHLRWTEMSQHTKKVWKWWLIAALFLVVGRLLAGCTHPVQVVEIEPWSPCAFGELCQIGQVVCSDRGEPMILTRRGIDPEEKFFTVVHEEVHVRQMQGNCRATAERYSTDPEFQWKSELEAYCVETEARIKSGEPANQAIYHLRVILRTLFHAVDEDIVCNFQGGSHENQRQAPSG